LHKFELFRDFDFQVTLKPAFLCFTQGIFVSIGCLPVIAIVFGPGSAYKQQHCRRFFSQYEVADQQKQATEYNDQINIIVEGHKRSFNVCKGYANNTHFRYIIYSGWYIIYLLQQHQETSVSNEGCILSVEVEMIKGEHEFFKLYPCTPVYQVRIHHNGLNVFTVAGKQLLQVFIS
jgi:hypothetical protein